MAKDRMDREERKHLRDPDEFITTTTSAIEWARDNSRTVVIATIAVVGVLLAAGFFNSYQNAQRREANADLAGGIDEFRGGEYSQAATDLQEVASQWSGSAMAPLAEILAANSELRAGNAVEAIERLGSIDADALPSYLHQQRDFAWASALESQGDWEAAAKKYAQAAKRTGPYRGDAMIGEARMRAKNGEVDEARELYERVLVEFPDRMDKEFLSAKAS